MTFTKHELKQSKTSFLVWTISITFLMVICIFLYPEMKKEMNELNDVFSSMGAFTSAFGMDKLNFGTLIGYYAIECGNVLGLGGAFFAALSAVGVLSKEEKDKTAEFLFTHPVSRFRIISEKLLSVMIQITAMNLIVYAISIISMKLINEDIAFKEISLMNVSFFILQIELACICFCISAFLRKGSIGIGIGIAAIMYFLNLIANITKSAEFLKYITPFGYCDGADIVSNGSLYYGRIAIGLVISFICVTIGYLKYMKKDIY